MPPKKNEADGKELDSKFKFRALKVYASDEWMANSTKKYRQVFDRFELTYVRAEFSFYNKLFDEGDWEANLRLKCFEIKGSREKELCNLEDRRKIGSDQNIVYFHQSWGNKKPGSYWKGGTYRWEAYIDEEKIGESKFYIEDVGESATGENRYFDISSIRLFEGDDQAYSVKNKKYLKGFKQTDTRYVWCEFTFTNKLDSAYNAEIFFNYYDKAGLPKGSQSVLTYVDKKTKGRSKTLTPGWGGSSPGRWKGDAYTLEVVFMDELIATIPFQVGEDWEEGDPELVAGNPLGETKPFAIQEDKSNEELLEESLRELDNLVGLDNIKKEVKEMVQLVRFYQDTGKDILNRFSLHTVFTGNPGTGKTTIARLLSKIYRGLGILEKGHLVEVDREGLVAGYIGQTAIKTAEKVNEAMGGILFIDEAYSLAQSRTSSNDFGAEAIQVILKRMEDFRGQFGVIVAGYPANMHEFIGSNPGLRSRFDKYFKFPDYEPGEMFAIALRILQKEEVQPVDEAAAHLDKYFHFLFENRNDHFGNARTVRQVVSKAVRNQHLRLAAMPKEKRTPELLETLLLEDVTEFKADDTNSGKKPVGFQFGDGPPSS